MDIFLHFEKYFLKSHCLSYNHLILDELNPVFLQNQKVVVRFHSDQDNNFCYFKATLLQSVVELSSAVGTFILGVYGTQTQKKLIFGSFWLKVESVIRTLLRKSNFNV